MLIKSLKKFACKKRKKTNETNEKFFQTQKGGYGYGDFFLGVRVPDVRKVARKNSNISLNDLQKEIQSKYHEVRQCSLFILVEKNKKADQKERKEILEFYLKNLNCINN